MTILQLAVAAAPPAPWPSDPKLNNVWPAEALRADPLVASMVSTFAVSIGIPLLVFAICYRGPGKLRVEC